MPVPTWIAADSGLGIPTSWVMIVGDLVAPGLELLGDAPQQLAALRRRSLRPCGERGLGRGHRAVDVGRHTGGDGGEHLLGGGVDHLEGVGPRGRHPRTVDVELVEDLHGEPPANTSGARTRLMLPTRG